MELLIPTEKISLLLKVSQGISVTVEHPSLGNHCSWFVLVLAVLLVLCQCPVPWEQHSVRAAPGEGNSYFSISKCPWKCGYLQSYRCSVSVCTAVLKHGVFSPWSTCSCLYSNRHLGVSSQAVLVVLVSPNPACLYTKEEVRFQSALKHWKTC